MAKNPTGLKVERKGYNFILTWKPAESYDAQQLEYVVRSTRNLVITRDYAKGRNIYNWKWKSVSIGKSATNKKITVDSSLYYPVKNYGAETISFRVRGKKSGKWSDWSEIDKDFKISPAPSLGVSYTEGVEGEANFSWSFTAEDSKWNYFYDLCWESILVKDNSTSDGSKLAWNSSTLGWATNTLKKSDGSWSKSDASALIQGEYYTRWFRAKTRSIAGDSDWRYARAIYAKPNKANISYANAVPISGGYSCTVVWDAPATQARPIERSEVKYLIAKPAAGMTVPNGANWSDAPSVRDSQGDDKVVFDINDTLDVDECLFVKVITIYRTYSTESDPKIALVGTLADTGTISITDIDVSQHKVTLSSANNSEVPDSQVAVIFNSNNSPYNGSVIGIIQHGQSSITALQCPDWGDESPHFGTYAFVGTATAKEDAGGFTAYAIKEDMRSKNTTYDGGDVPMPPTGVTATQTDTADTILVTWKWSWDEADSAVISWADHKNAWESTNEPQSYKVSGIHASKWYISGLETGKTWYIRVKLVKEVGDVETSGPWSAINLDSTVDLSSAPRAPYLELSKGVVAKDDTFTASWTYETTDGTEQAYAEICEATVSGNVVTYGDVIAHEKTARHIDIDVNDLGWNTGDKKLLCAQVTASSGKKSEWSAPASVVVADAITAEITETSIEYIEEELNPHEETGSVVIFTHDDTSPVIRKLEAEIDLIQDGTPWTDSNIEKDPYLYRAMPQIGHDYNSEVYDSIVGASVAWNQQVTNGNFASDSGWVGSSGIVSVASNKLTFTASEKSNFANIGRTDLATAIIGHKYLVSADITLSEASNYVAINRAGVYSDRFFTLSANAKTRCAKIITPSIAGSAIYIYPMREGTGLEVGSTMVVENVMCIDLTVLFGSAEIADYVYSLEQANAGAGIAWLRNHGFIDGAYHEYDSGSLKSVEGVVSHDTVGFNQWDEEWELGGINTSGQETTTSGYYRSKNYTAVLPNTTYYFKVPTTMSVMFYDSNKDFIEWTTANNATVTTPSNCRYLRFRNTKANTWAPYNHDICINLSSDRNGEYEPYRKHSYPLDDSLTLRGIYKLDASNRLYADGDVYPPSGEVGRRYASVTFNGTESGWTASDGYVNRFYRIDSTLGASSNLLNRISNYLTPTEWGSTAWTFAVRASGYIYVCLDPSATAMTVDDFKAYLASHPLTIYYELATPTTESADPYQQVQIVDDSGTEEFVIDSGSFPVPVGHQTRYQNAAPISGRTEITAYISPTTDAEDATVYVENLGRTVYVGSVDVISGDLTVTTGYIASYNGETIGEPWWSSVDQYVSGTTPSAGAQVVYTLDEPQTYRLTPRDIEGLVGANNIWADSGDVDVRYCDLYLERYVLGEMPMTVTVTGAGGGTTTIVVRRAESYHIDRPDGKEFDGYEHETIVSASYTGEEQATFDVDDCVGSFDDGAQYELIATVKDSYGQVDSITIDFTVEWEHQAKKPSGEVVIDGLIAKITPIAPQGAIASDKCDVYRLSADMPELILKNAEFGTLYVDPYPAIGGGYRFVTRTKNGDYITEDNEIAWLDVESGFSHDKSIIDFDGETVELNYNVDIGNTWEKDFKATRYLGGSVKGDWNLGVSRTQSLGTSKLTEFDAEDITALRRLAEHAGQCHVRTTDGSSFTADLQVAEDRSHDNKAVANFSITGTRIDPQELDGLTYEKWAEGNELE